MGDRRARRRRPPVFRGRTVSVAVWLPLLLGRATARELGAPAGSSALPPGALRVQLVFGEEADLDLYVTDPALETVYFANSPSRQGGELESDVRCDAPAPRVETVRFSTPAAGRYRVGVDFPARCRRSADEAPYAMRVEGDGPPREVRGKLPFGRFEPRVLEFVVEP